MGFKQIGRAGTLCIMAVVGGGTAVQAQTIPRVTVSIHTGVGGGGAPAQLENLLRAAGMNDVPIDFGGFLGSLPDNPHSDVTPAIGGEVRVRVRPRLSVGFSASTSSDGSTHGFHSSSFLSPTVNFDADYAVRSIAPMVTWHPTPRLRAGAGPALHRVTLNNPAAGVSIRKTMIGWTTDAGFAFFNGKRMFSEITAQYRGMGSIDLDPITLTGTPSFPGQEPTTVNLPGTSVSYRHWVVGVSFGLKFG